MEVKEKKIEVREIRKILVKCPPGIENVFSVFPFLVTLGEEYPKAEINIIAEENCSAAFNFLPYRAYFFERPKQKRSLFQTHHYCANLNDVFNIDLFFDLENNFNSAFMGFNFRSIERVGYETGMNKYFLTKKFTPHLGSMIETESLNLLGLYKEKNYQTVKILKEKDEGLRVEAVEQLFQEPIPPKFILIMLDNFKNVTTQIELWTKFFDCFHGQKFIIWSMADDDLLADLFASVDLGNNSLFMHRGQMHKGQSAKELTYLLNKVRGVVVNNIWAEGLCTYYGVNALSFFSYPTPVFPTYEHFLAKPQRFIFSGSGLINYTYLTEKKEFTEMNQVVDRIHFLFKL